MITVLGVFAAGIGVCVALMYGVYHSPTASSFIDTDTNVFSVVMFPSIIGGGKTWEDLSVTSAYHQLQEIEDIPVLEVRDCGGSDNSNTMTSCHDRGHADNKDKESLIENTGECKPTDQILGNTFMASSYTLKRYYGILMKSVNH